MKKLFGWFTLLLIGWSLGWVSHRQWTTEPEPTVSIRQPLLQKPTLRSDSNSSSIKHIGGLAQRNGLEMISRSLKKNDFQNVLEHFEALQKTVNDAVVQQARNLILSYARQLINAKRYRLAKHLLNHYLQNAFRDVDAHLLLAEINLAENDYQSAINKLYEAKGYAYRTETINQIQERIRRTVDKQTKLLQQNNNNVGILKLYQQLTQLEPDYAPYFLRLATAQLALNDTSGARRSLHLITQDPDVGVLAQALLNKLIRSAPENTEKSAQVKTVAIPLLRSGDNFLVDALLNNTRQVRLLIDTGASMTILTPDILQRGDISYQDTGKTRLFNTVNGQVRAPVYEIESLSLGDWHVNQIEIGVMPLDNVTTFHGLLGMNFLKHFQFFIDQNEANLRLQGIIEN